LLTEAEQHEFEANGFCGPFALDNPALADLALETTLRELKFSPANDSIKAQHVLGDYKEDPRVLANAHHTHPAILQLGLDKAIIARLKTLMGPEIYLRRSQFWRKPAHGRGVIWHQDTHRKMGLGCIGEFSAWVALEDSTLDNGCVRLLRGSHKAGVVPPESVIDPSFRIRFFASEALQVPEPLLRYQAVPMTMRKGQFFLFHQLCFHASGPNRTAATRTGVVYRYLSDAGIESVTEKLIRVSTPAD
jgi:ectoine hydroxylase-related dioxygenase (phytanoyl-CoA dioxygenase family)